MDHAQEAQIIEESARQRAKMEPLLHAVSVLSIGEMLSFIATIMARLYDTMGEREFSFWFFTLMRGFTGNLKDSSVITHVSVENKNLS